MIDLSAMRAVSIDAPDRTARVGPGALLADFDRAAQAHGLATPLGINSTTGVAGLTLGGGFGWLTRRYGMTIDNLLAATVVTADGEVRVASATSRARSVLGVARRRRQLRRRHLVRVSVCTRSAARSTPASSSTRSRRRDAYCARGAISPRDAPDELSVWARAAQGAAAAVPSRIGARNRGRRARARLQRRRCRGTARRRAGRCNSASRSRSALMPTPYAGFQTAFDPLLTPGPSQLLEVEQLQRR